MTARAQWLIVLAVVALLGGGLAVATLTMGDELFPITPGTKAPEIRAVTLDEVPEERTLAEYRGQVVLLNVWATWCGPCEAEMPSMELLHRAYADSGLRIVAVSIDDPGSEETIREFVARYGLTFDILHDPAKNITRAYRITGYPETFVIGRDGVIRRKTYVQDWNTPANRALISQLVHEDAPQPIGDRRAPVSLPAKTP
jgi:peroxiredoxin